MDGNVLASISVSVISLTVIFTVLTILIFTIKILVRLIPYEAPAAPQSKPAPRPAGPSDIDEHVAAITAVMSGHLGKGPHQFRIVGIKPRGS